jgi:hypothetical protein
LIPIVSLKEDESERLQEAQNNDEDFFGKDFIERALLD